MKRFCCVGLVLITASTLGAERPPSFTTGIELIGGERCPVMIGAVWPGSPAAAAHIQSGDLLTAVDGTKIATGQEASRLLHSTTPNKVTLELVRGERPYTVTINRERVSSVFYRLGQKVLENGMIVPLDASEAEMKDKMLTLKLDRFVGRVFPSHYPSNENLYYPGFEVLLLKNPTQVVVLGIEDGPASRAGVHWGDTILSVNGIDPRHKSISELESLFASVKAVLMTLTIERGSVRKTFSFRLAQAAQVLHDNGLQLVKGQTLPLGIPKRYLSCFE